jgi:hypothetical protein
MQHHESSSPPAWAQTLLQQMAQTQAMQNEERERHSQQEAAQEERIRRLEAMLDQQASLTATTTTTTEGQTTPARSATEPAPERQRMETVYRPRARLPDPVLFGGNTNDWPTWRVTIENKLSVDGEAIGSPQDQFMYVFSRLEKLAWKNTGTFVKLRRNTSEPQALLNYLENIYGDPNVKARAARRLHQIRQPENMTFSKFLPRLEKEFADADALEWHDEAKRQILLGALNKTMTRSLMNRGIPATFSDLISRLHEISTDMDALNINKDERARRPHSPKRSDEMDWTPTISVNRTEPRAKHRRSEGESTKQAQWASQDELDRRRNEGKCLRCGRSGHFIAKCALLPAQPPSRTRIATGSGKKRREHTTHVKKSRPTSDRESVTTASDDEDGTTEDDSGKE